MFISAEPIVTNSVKIHNILAPEYSKHLEILKINNSVVLYAHLSGGFLLVFSGLLQVLKYNKKFHRIVGRIYVILVSIVVVTGFGLLDNPFGGESEKIPTLIFGFLLLFSTFFAIFQFLDVNKNLSAAARYRLHQNHMSISYAIVLGPMTIRIVYVLLWMIFGISEVNTMTPSFWIGWGLNFIVAIYFLWPEDRDGVVVIRRASPEE